MNCLFCKQELHAMKTRNTRINGKPISMHVCEDCNSFFAYNTSDGPKEELVTYYFVCVEPNHSPEGNYIVEINPQLNTTTIKFLPMEEDKELQTVYTFDSVLPLNPQNVHKKIKTYVMFS